MPFDPHENLVLATITIAPDPASSGITLSLSNDEAEFFPDPAVDGEYNVTVWAVGEMPQPANAEIVRITAKGDPDSGGEGNTEFTIEREQEETLPREIEVGDMIALTITKKTVKDIEDAIEEAKAQIDIFEASYTARAVVGKGDNAQYTDIQSAIDDVAAAGGGIVFIQEGIYSITSAIKIPSNIQLKGAGWATILQAASGLGATENMIENSDQSNGNTGIFLKNLKLDANGIAYRIIDFIKANDGGIIGCFLYNASATYQIAHNRFKCDRFIFSNNFVKKNWICNFTDYCNNAVITNNYFEDNYDSDISVGTGGMDMHNIIIANNIFIKPSASNSGFCIDIFGDVRDSIIANNICYGGNLDNIIIQKDGTSTYYPKRITVIGNRCYNSGRRGILVDADAGLGEIDIIGNYVLSPTTHGIEVHAPNCKISGNTIVDIGSDYQGIYAGTTTTYSHPGFVITGNRLKEAGGIYGHNLRGATVANNVVDGAYYAGIWFRGFQDGSITGNVVKNSGQGAVAGYDDGILLDDGNKTVTGSINNAITGNRCYDDQGSKTQDYGIKTTGSANYNVVTGNNVRGNKTGGLSLAGANNLYQTATHSDPLNIVS